MEVIAHRGIWKKNEERNSYISLERAVLAKVGTETDLRDLKKRIVISHDIPSDEVEFAERFFRLYRGSRYTLALNIKADGLQTLLKMLLEQYEIENYFCFDMSVPDTLEYIEKSIKFFTRESEYESVPVFYKEAEGVWIDGFKSDDWITEEKILRYLNDGKKVCLVSPELHNRRYQEKWEEYRTYACGKSQQLFLCTDHPIEAKEYFKYEED